MSNEQTQTGIIKFTKEDGYGFIIKNDGTGDVFYHISGVIEEAELKKGDNVEFIVKEGKRGPIAVDVVKVNG